MQGILAMRVRRIVKAVVLRSYSEGMTGRGRGLKVVSSQVQTI